MLVALSLAGTAQGSQFDWRFTDKQVLQAPDVSVLLFHNAYHPVFGDQKMSGVELILHEQRIATNGDVRLSATPAQWDPIPVCEHRVLAGDRRALTIGCVYSGYGLHYQVVLMPETDGFRLSVRLAAPVPAELAGKAGFNLEFLPARYFGKTFLADSVSGVFARHPAGPMQPSGEPSALASARSFVLAPEDPLVSVAVSAESGTIQLYDGRNQAQNGWFVLRTTLPQGATGDVVVWHVRPRTMPGWRRAPVIAYNQAGYTPERAKVAVVELDPRFDAPKTARVLQILSDGTEREVLRPPVTVWGNWLRYRYARFDFSAVRRSGSYVLEFAGHKTAPFRIAPDVYQGLWRPSMATYLPEQMDHVKVREGYRIWHGASHLDDARQAPTDYTHFDGYRQAATTDSPYKPGEHIPGLNVGGWYDAGDFDLRTQTQTRVIMDLVAAREQFGLNDDDTSVDEAARSVEMRKPDGVPDVIQQIQHGVALLLAQYRTFGHSIPGIIEPTLTQYTHLGDAASKTDGRVYDAHLGALQISGDASGAPDDRWAFTTRTTALSYDAVGALAAATRVLRPFDPKVADACLSAAKRAWDEEQTRPPVLFRYFNTTGTDLEQAEVEAAVELLIASGGDAPYRARLDALRPRILEQYRSLAALAARAVPYMDEAFKADAREAARRYAAWADQLRRQNPYGVPIADGEWGGAAEVTGFGVDLYQLHRAFPDLVDASHTLDALDYVLGRHPVSNLSYVSTVGTESKLVAYGNNRADYTFIPGGMVPGVVIVQPDFPELTSDWPFFWYENEYVVDAATSFVLVSNAASALTRELQR
jgi:hypothetical protein